MKRKVIQARASNMLCLLSTCSIVQPFSLQPTVQVDVPLDEWVLLVRSMCASNAQMYQSIFTIQQYKRIVTDYDAGKRLSAEIFFTFDMFYACVMELKKAVARNKSATVITLNYGNSEDIENIQFDDIAIHLNAQFVAEGNDHRLFNQAIDEVNRAYNTLPVSYQSLNVHNKNYYSYVTLLRYRLAFASNGSKFVPFNMRI